ncbi:MAG: dihydropyrimidinase [Armatimonadota bacterium]|nr:dihydropyrimidinase [Armatimonadota bacterium]MDR7426974.1 dihydropyrimidinase [Armatimonadota bacterium]MDR7463108.1 dihydropyrimidinase [Armatimonadota bacterium]MDR7469309.1 dihydropyrimidinase [Armatimonadota bacterium]MDR7475525.1 dihydropyrimidinase [Armatimonadota bacterium]
MRTLFRGGTVVTAERTFAADVLVDGERIAAIAPELSADGAPVVDASGLYLLPGGIDVHTHLDMPLEVGGREITTADDFYSGQVAAAFGGTTAHIDFVIQPKGASLRQALDLWHAKAAGKAVIDYGFHMTIADPTPQVLQEIALLPQWGVTSVKVLLAYKGRLQVDDTTLLLVLRQAGRNGLLTLVHCENGDVIDLLIREAVAAGHLEPRFHPLTRPAQLEGEATGRALALAAVADAPVYVVHLTCAAALEQVRLARARGQRAWAETCIQYLFFTAEDLDRPGFEGAKFVCSPPFRSRDDQEALWGGLGDGTLAVVSTDHAPFSFEGQKTLGRSDFTRIPNGVPAIEDRLLMLYHAGVGGGRISLNRFVELVATNPARLFGLYPRKGTLAVGADADIVLWDPQRQRVLSARTHHMRVDYNLFEGTEVRGAPAGVWLRGQQVVDGEQFLGSPGSGRYLQRARFFG